MKSRLVVVVLIAVLTVASLGHAVAVQYRVRDLGTISSNQDTRASDINNKNQVVGYEAAGGYSRGALFEPDGSRIDIPFHTFRLNDAGQVAGWETVNYMGYGRARVWSDGQAQPTGELAGYDYSQAGDINEHGMVVGSSYLGYPDERHVAFRWTSETGPIQLETPLGYSSATAEGVNESDEVIGSASRSVPGGFERVACLWDAAGTVTTLGHLAGSRSRGGDRSIAHAVNDRGVVVGASTYGTMDATHAFIWSASSGMVDLGTTGGSVSEATDINNPGQVVGWSYASVVLHEDAFVWSSQAGMIILPGLPGSGYSHATAINDAGYIAGFSAYGGQLHAVLWEPVAEPSGLLALLCGLGGIAALARRTRPVSSRRMT